MALSSIFKKSAPAVTRLISRALLCTVVVATFIVSGCDDHRDLHVRADPMLSVTGDWQPSLGEEGADMRNQATALAWRADEESLREFFLDPGNRVSFRVGSGTYDVMIFNGLMYSGDQTHLDGVTFVNTEKLTTFAALAEPGNLNRRLTRADGEYIATNDMEIVASMTAQQIIETDGTYHIKYQNGKNGFDTPDDYIEAELAMVPHALSFPCRVEVEVYGNSNMIGAAASLKGFAGSALMSSRQPSSDFTVTHQLTLNNKQQMGAADEDRVSIYSPEFVTFGPPLDGARVELDLRFGLVNGEYYDPGTIDVTDQLAQFISDVKSNLTGVQPVKHELNIHIKVTVELPEVDPVEGAIELGEWSDEEIINFPVSTQKPKAVE